MSGEVGAMVRILGSILSKWEGFGGSFTRGCMRTVGYGSSGG